MKKKKTAKNEDSEDESGVPDVVYETDAPSAQSIEVPEDGNSEDSDQ